MPIDRGRREQRTPDIESIDNEEFALFRKLDNGAAEEDVEHLVERLSQDAVVQALSAVPHHFREVIVLVDIGDFTYQDAAQILDIPIGTVMSRLHRGRRILKRELEATVRVT